MSAIPAVLDALVSSFESALELGGVQVLDGQPAADIHPDVVVVGWSPERVSVEGDRDQAGLGSDRERFTVVCLASSWSGDTDMKPRRDRAFELFQGVVQVLKLDPTVRGTAARARATVTNYVGEQTSKGAMATVEFEISVDAFHA